MAIIIAISTIINGCKKGDTGPAGTNGTNGNANVSSTNFTITSWSSDSIIWFTDLLVPALSSGVDTGDAIEVFFSADPPWFWSALPYTQIDTNNYFMQFDLIIGEIVVKWFNKSNGHPINPNSYYHTNLQFKVVVIPPAMKRNDINLYNWTELKNAYNLKD